MLYQLVLFAIKIIFGTSLGLLGVYHAKKRKKKMRIYDTLTPESQNEILSVCVGYAKGEIVEFNLPASTDVIGLAVQYDTMFFLTPIDFAGFNTESVPAFVGPRPIKRP
jgi:hypothetical protein